MGCICVRAELCEAKGRQQTKIHDENFGREVRTSRSEVQVCNANGSGRGCTPSARNGNVSQTTLALSDRVRTCFAVKTLVLLS